MAQENIIMIILFNFSSLIICVMLSDVNLWQYYYEVHNADNAIIEHKLREVDSTNDFIRVTSLHSY